MPPLPFESRRLPAAARALICENAMLSSFAYAAGMEVANPLRRFDPGAASLVVVLHVLALLGLAHALAPDLMSGVPASRPSTVTVVTFVPEAQPTPEPTPQAKPDSGAQGAPGRRAVARDAAAPPVVLPLRPLEPIPNAPSDGEANRSGAADAGEGTGAGGVGTGTGSGYGGNGGGGWVEPTKPVKIAGDINSAADYPIPPGGRQVRRGSFVEIYMTVGTDGRASNCRVITPSVDSEADRVTCRLAEERFRFEPARNSNGDPVAYSYGWRQRWF